MGKEPRIRRTTLSLADRALWLALGGVIVATPLGFFGHLSVSDPQPSQSATFVLGACLCGLLTAILLASGRARLSMRPIWGVALAAMAASMALSVAIADDPIYALSRLLLPAAGIVFFLAVVASCRGVADSEKLWGLWAAVGVVVSAVAILQSAGVARTLGLPEGGQGKLKIVSLFGHPNHLASALVPIVFLTLAWGGPANRSKDVIRYGALLIQAIALILSGTRGAWLAAFGGTAAYCLLLARAGRMNRRVWIKVGAGAAVLALFALLLLVPSPLISAHFDLRERLISTAEARSRFHSWLVAADMARERPILGHGLGSYEAKFWDGAARRQAGPSGRWFETTLIRINAVPPVHPHNEALSLAVEQGLAGVFAAALLVACGLAAAWRLSRPDLSGVESAGPENGAETGGRPEFSRTAAALGAGILACGVDACFMFPFHLATSLAAFLSILACLARLESLVGPSARPRNWGAAVDRLKPGL